MEVMAAKKHIKYEYVRHKTKVSIDEITEVTGR